MSEHDYLISKALRMPKMFKKKPKQSGFSAGDDWTAPSWNPQPHIIPSQAKRIKRFNAPSPKIKPQAPGRTPAQQERAFFASEKARDAKAAGALQRDRSAKEFARYNASQSRSRGGF